MIFLCIIVNMLFIPSITQMIFGGGAGPGMHTPKQFNKEVRGSGIGFTTIGMKEKMRIPA